MIGGWQQRIPTPRPKKPVAGKKPRKQTKKRGQRRKNKTRCKRLCKICRKYKCKC